MVLALFRRSGNRQTIDRLHAAIVAAARQEAFYQDYHVADTVDGRFELLILHAAFLARHLNGCPPPGPDVAQDLTDAVFRHLDSSLREVGIGDTSVPRRMKKLAQAFFGRASVYAEALQSPDDVALGNALARNVFGGSAPDGCAQRLARYVRVLVAQLAALSLDEVLSRLLSNDKLYPDPASID